MIPNTFRLKARRLLAPLSVDRPFSSSTKDILSALRRVDTSSLCDADKSRLAIGSDTDYNGLKLMRRLQPLNNLEERNNVVMAGVARTVQLNIANDFLAVLQGLDQAEEDEVLVINTMDSDRAVAGELFCAEAERRGLSGIVVDGPARDTIHLQNYKSLRFYSKSVSPYSGTTQSPGIMQVPITCGDVQVEPGDIVVGDLDGVLVGSAESFREILPMAQQIQEVEEKLRAGILSGKSLSSHTNLEQHLKKRLQNETSALEFQV